MSPETARFSSLASSSSAVCKMPPFSSSTPTSDPNPLSDSSNSHLFNSVCIGSIYRAKIVHKIISLDASCMSPPSPSCPPPTHLTNQIPTQIPTSTLQSGPWSKSASASSVPVSPVSDPSSPSQKPARVLVAAAMRRTS